MKVRNESKSELVVENSTAILLRRRNMHFSLPEFVSRLHLTISHMYWVSHTLIRQENKEDCDANPLVSEVARRQDIRAWRVSLSGRLSERLRSRFSPERLISGSQSV